MKAKVHPFEKHLSKPGKPYGVASAEDPQVSLPSGILGEASVLCKSPSPVATVKNPRIHKFQFKQSKISPCYFITCLPTLQTETFVPPSESAVVPTESLAAHISSLFSLSFCHHYCILHLFSFCMLLSFIIYL